MRISLASSILELLLLLPLPETAGITPLISPSPSIVVICYLVSIFPWFLLLPDSCADDPDIALDYEDTVALMKLDIVFNLSMILTLNSF